MTDPRLARPSWRGRTNVDALTIACIEHAETIGGHEFVVTQGSYQNTVAASAGTHDGGGAVDLRWCGHAKCVRALRQAGMAAWHRNPSQGPWPDHIHAVVVDHPALAPSAARQVASYRAGRNGLASNGPDDGPRLSPIPTPVWPWPPVPKTLPKRVVRYLAETLAIRKELTREIQRLKAARKVAKAKGELTGKYTRAIRQTREARKTLRVAREAARRVPKR